MKQDSVKRLTQTRGLQSAPRAPGSLDLIKTRTYVHAH